MMRMTTMGQLTASIAPRQSAAFRRSSPTPAPVCECSMPILRILKALVETARRTIRDGNLASEVITRLRALFSKRQATTELVDLNEATREVIELLSSKLQRGCVILWSELADDLPPITGDRVQLQQVIMNLLQNAADAMIDVPDWSRQLLIQTRRDEADHVRHDRAGQRHRFRSAGRQASCSMCFTPPKTAVRESDWRSADRLSKIITAASGRPNRPGGRFPFSIPRSPGRHLAGTSQLGSKTRR